MGTLSTTETAAAATAATATATTATATAATATAEEDDLLTDTETVLTESSISSNEDDAYFPRHPGNSVWVQHSFL